MAITGEKSQQRSQIERGEMQTEWNLGKLGYGRQFSSVILSHSHIDAVTLLALGWFTVRINLHSPGIMIPSILEVILRDQSALIFEAMIHHIEFQHTWAE